MHGRTALIAVLLAVGTVAAQDVGGTASGTLTVNGKAIKLTHAYAVKKGTGETAIVVADVALTSAQLSDRGSLGDLMRVSNVHAIEAIVPKDQSSPSVQLYDQDLGFDSVIVTGANHKLELANAGKELSGKLYTQRPDSYDHVPYEYTVSFKAPVIEPAPMRRSAGPRASSPRAY